MPNKTIYVSGKDEELFNEAQKIAGSALSSVISKALSEYVTRHKEQKKGMKEVSITIGTKDALREQRFIGAEVSKWQGFSDDKEWWQEAKIYKTQKGNWAVLLTTVSKASLLIDRKTWKKSGDYLIDQRRSELFISDKPEALTGKVPQEVVSKIEAIKDKSDGEVEYLDI